MGNVSVLASPKTDITALKADKGYYTKLKDENGADLAGNPSLTISKYVKGNKSKPIEGVIFKYAKVGNLYEITDGNQKIMAYGISTALAKKIGIQEDADYAKDSISYFKNAADINRAFSRKTKEDIEDFVTKQGTTGKNGAFSASMDGYGVYLIAEWDIGNAKVDGEPASITKTQSPFVAAVPTAVTADGTTYWEENVAAEIKNNTGTADVEKKIVDSLHDMSEGKDTDITHIGDIVYFRLTGEVLQVPPDSNEKITAYKFTDDLSQGLTPDFDSITVKTMEGNTENPISLEKNKDFTVTSLDYAGGRKEFAGGKTITIEFTAAGKEKLTDWAKKTESNKKTVQIFYCAKVNEKAVSGAGNPAGSGNPNEVSLTYEVGSGQIITTKPDKVVEFTFEIDVLKQLAGNSNLTSEQKNDIQFVLYSEKDGQKTYYTFTGADGAYVVRGKAADKESAVKMNPNQKGKISMRGLESGTYYLEELQTVSGYHLLKEAVKVDLTAATGTNAYVADEKNTGTIYTGSVKIDADGIVSMTINNTKGFEFPPTGGKGIWLFVLGGIMIIAAGIIYFTGSQKGQKTK